MADLTIQTPSLTGAVLTFAACAALGDAFLNSGHEFVVIRNASGGPVNVTFDAPNACSLGITSASHDKVVACADAVDTRIGPFPKARFNDAARKVQITYASETDLSIAVLGDV